MSVSLTQPAGMREHVALDKWRKDRTGESMRNFTCHFADRSPPANAQPQARQIASPSSGDAKRTFDVTAQKS